MSNTIQNLQEEIDKLGQQIEQNSSIEDVQLKEIALEENRSLKLQIDNLTKAIEQIEKGSQSKQDDSQNSPTNPNKAIVEIRAGTGVARQPFLLKTCMRCTQSLPNSKDGRLNYYLSQRN